MKTKTTSLMICCLLLGSGSAFAQPNEPGAGNCLKFDGVDDYVEILYNNSLDLTNEITIEMWIFQFAESTAGGVGVTKENAYKFGPCMSSQYVLRMETTGGTWYNQDFYSNSPTVLNEWVHIAATYQAFSHTAKIYINGVLDNVSTSEITGTIETNNSSLWLGRGLYPYLNGQIDEVRIWNYARSQSEIRRDMCRKLQGNEPGLVGYWRFDEGSGSTAFDSSPNGNDGTLQ